MRSLLAIALVSSALGGCGGGDELYKVISDEDAKY